MESAIVVEGLGKQYRRYHPGRPWTLQEAFLSGLRWIRPEDSFWALRDVTFEIGRGRMVGVVGRNGAGKSTLLRLMGKIGRPDEGSLKTHGRVGALLDLGASFHPELTGRENVFISGIVAGLTRRQVAERLESIMAFAELHDFMDSPLRTYSTGMQMRLAFAIAVHTEPEILLIDEVLAVGDILFQRKCLERIVRFKDEGCTIILVSHDMATMRQFCDEVLWLKKGRLIAHGPAEVVTGQYVAEADEETRSRTPREWPVLRTSSGNELRVNKNRFGSLELEITAVRLLDPRGLIVTERDSGDSLSIEVDYQARGPISSPTFEITITREDNMVCYDTNTAAASLVLPTIQGKGRIILHLDRLDLSSGLYYFDVGAYERDWAYAYDYHWHVYPLIIRATAGEKGILHPPHRWEISNATGID
jgi:lipopolysaccharide transport system ATP-binding protein